MAQIHYDILQIKPEASAEEIQHAYRKLALRYHPDHNPDPDAAVRMTTINEAYEVLRGSMPRGVTDPPVSMPDHGAELTLSILSAARAVVLRNGWAVHYDDGSIAVFEISKPCVRIVLADRLTKDLLQRFARQYRELAAVLAVHIEGPIAAGSGITIIDLMRAERHGAPVHDGPCKSLLSGFL